jgi:hypothetical protein
MWKKWKRLKKETRIAICSKIAFVSLMAFFISAAGMETMTSSAPFWCATVSLASLTFFGWLGGWMI